MIDITEKKAVKRIAIATGKITLKKTTISEIIAKNIRKGDVLEAAKIAGINSVKQTQLLIPYCHQIPITSVKFDFIINPDNIMVECNVKTIAKTGVEMESLVGVTIALNTIWDMVKYLEKDEQGQYHDTIIGDIRVIKKTKGE